jgi:hypothetical protein
MCYKRVSDYVDNYKDIYDGVHDVLVLNEDADSSDEEEEADGMSFFFVVCLVGYLIAFVF